MVINDICKYEKVDLRIKPKLEKIIIFFFYKQPIFLKVCLNIAYFCICQQQTALTAQTISFSVNYQDISLFLI